MEKRPPRTWQRRGKAGRFCRHRLHVLTSAAVCFGLESLATNAQAHDEVTASSKTSGPPRIQAAFHGDIVIYSQHTGGNLSDISAMVHGLDGYHATMLALPKLSDGVGYAFGAGMFVRHVVGDLSVSAVADFTRVNYSTDYGWNMASRDAHLSTLGFDEDVIVDSGWINPFLGVSVGATWLSLPGSVINIDLQNQSAVYGFDAVMHGVMLRPNLGVLCRFTPAVALDLRIGYALYYYYSSSAFSFDGSWLTARGWTLTFGIPIFWPS